MKQLFIFLFSSTLLAFSSFGYAKVGNEGLVSIYSLEQGDIFTHLTLHGSCGAVKSANIEQQGDQDVIDAGFESSNIPVDCTFSFENNTGRHFVTILFNKYKVYQNEKGKITASGFTNINATSAEHIVVENSEPKAIYHCHTRNSFNQHCRISRVTDGSVNVAVN